MLLIDIYIYAIVGRDELLYQTYNGWVMDEYGQYQWILNG